MKKILVALAIAAFASNAMAIIAGSPHDLSATGPGTYAGGTLSSCQYCHAPHRANITIAGAPLWNRNTPAALPSGYTSNTVSSQNTPGANSITCLSCHDGVSDMGATYTGSNGFPTAPTVMTGAMAVSSAANNGLQDDHPVGIRYALTGGTGTGYKTKISVKAALKLYGAAGLETVECASCHDPHNDRWGGGTDVTMRYFIRGTAGIAGLCSTCHDK
jgi:hypothetical protein